VSRRNKTIAVGVGEISRPAQSPGTVDLVDESIRQSVVRVNVSQQMIILTEDRVRLRLDHFLRMEKKRREWYVPAGMLLTEIAASVTSTFHGAIGVSGVEWQAVFQVITVMTAVWLMCALTTVRRGASVDSLIDSLKHCQHAGNRPPEEASRL
jgi:hypothetical protein